MSNFGISISDTSVPGETQVFSLSEIHRFVKECALTVGTPLNHADALAECLTEADYRGHYCEGLYQLHAYIDEIQHYGCDKDAVPSIVKETPVTAWVDGHNGLGVIVSNFCMNLAIKKAKTNGIGWVVAKCSNSYGMASIYPMQAVKEGLIGMSFTNSSPLVAPSRAVDVASIGVKRALGTNPLSVAAPALNGDSFILDMSTAAVSVGKIEILGRRKLPVPTEWANPETGTLRPLGGQDSTANYKGFGLALFVEILCGILGDAAYGPNVRKYGNFCDAANLGHCFVAIDPNQFAPGFEERLSDLLNYIRNMQPIDPINPVIVPGDMERQHMAVVDRQGGVYYHKDLLTRCLKLAEKLDVTPLSPVQ